MDCYNPSPIFERKFSQTMEKRSDSSDFADSHEFTMIDDIVGSLSGFTNILSGKDHDRDRKADSLKRLSQKVVQSFSLSRLFHPNDPKYKSPKKGSAKDSRIAEVVSIENTEDGDREAIFEEEDNARFTLRHTYIQEEQEARKRCVWSGAREEAPTPLHMKVVNDSFFRLMKSRIRQDFHKIFPYGVANSALSLRSVATLVACQVMIDMALLDDDIHSLAFIMIPGTRISLDNCPPDKRHIYFSFMAFKFTDVRTNPDGLRDLTVQYFYHLAQKCTAGERVALLALLQAVRHVVMSQNFVSSVSAFYLEVINLEEEFRSADKGLAEKREDFSTTIGFNYQRGSDPVGYGTSGTVYCCYRDGSDKVYALKVVPLNDGGDKESIVRGEISMLHRLRHPRVIRYYGCYFDRRRHECGIMMEYAPQTLRHRIDETKGLPLSTIAMVASQILEGLAYLHLNHIVHQDIKSSNILLGAKRTIKLGDLGNAVISEASQSKKTRLMGTPLFMAPEVCRYSRPSEASDIWSFGCTLLEMASGGYPWDWDWEHEDLEPGQLMFKIASCASPPSLPEDCPAASDPLFMDFFSQCLTMDALLRPDANTLLSHAFLTTQREGEDVEPLQAEPSNNLFISQESDLAALTDDDDD